MASKVTSGIDYRNLDPMSICLESQSAFQCIFLDPVFGIISLILLSALPGEDGRVPEICMSSQHENSSPNPNHNHNPEAYNNHNHNPTLNNS